MRRLLFAIVAPLIFLTANSRGGENTPGKPPRGRIPVAAHPAQSSPAQSSPAKSSPAKSSAAAPKRSVPQPSPAIEIEDCRVRLIDDVQLASARTGIIDLVATEGERVRPQQVVARLHDELLQAGLAITERQAANDIEVRFARKASELAQLKYARAAEASRAVAGTVSELELKELRLAAEKSLLQVEQTEQQFLVAGLRRDESTELLKTCRVVAPFEAEVLEVFKRPGEVVREGEPILRLASGSRMRVEGYLPIDQASRVTRGVPVQVRLRNDESGDLSREVFAGRLMFIDMKVEPVSRKVRIWAEVPNEAGLLRDGLTATMTFAKQPAEVARGNE